MRAPTEPQSHRPRPQTTNNKHIAMMMLRCCLSACCMVGGLAPGKMDGIPSTGGSGDALYRNHIETLAKENSKLKAKLCQLERENSDLKKSVFEISVAYTEAMERLRVMTLEASSSTYLPPMPERFSVDKALLASHQASQRTRSVMDASGHKGMEDTTAQSSGAKKKARQLHLKKNAALSGHTGPVYRVLFSPDGGLMASASFDHTVRIWNWSQYWESLCLRAHESLVSDISWRSDGERVVSCSFDHTVKVWDVPTATNKQSTGSGALSTALCTFRAKGLANTVECVPSDDHIVLVGTSRNAILAADCREGAMAFTMENDCSVNSLYAYQDGSYVVSGDSNGVLKLWDLRAREKPVFEDKTSESSICHVHACRGSGPGNEGRCMLVSSNDNVIRVYNRGAVIRDRRPTGDMVLMHSLVGHKTMNYPIKCSTYLGIDCTYQMDDNVSGDSFDTTPDDERPTARRFHSSFLAATASADGVPLLFDLSSATDDTLKRYQGLRGHDARVYDAAFHPHDPVLATGSADTNILIWSPSVSSSVY